MKRLAASFVAALSLLMLLSAQSAQAFSADRYGAKVLATAIETPLVPLECPKAIWQELTRWRERFIIGLLITAPVGCAVSTGARAVTTAGDWASNLILVDQHIAQPRAFETWGPLVPLPK